MVAVSTFVRLIQFSSSIFNTSDLSVISLFSLGNTYSPACLINLIMFFLLMVCRGLSKAWPNSWSRTVANASHWVKRWKEVCRYSSICCHSEASSGTRKQQRSQKGESRDSGGRVPLLTRSESTKKLCLLKKLWPVRTIMYSLSTALFSERIIAENQGSTSGSHLLVCL